MKTVGMSSSKKAQSFARSQTKNINITKHALPVDSQAIGCSSTLQPRLDCMTPCCGSAKPRIWAPSPSRHLQEHHSEINSPADHRDSPSLPIRQSRALSEDSPFSPCRHA